MRRANGDWFALEYQKRLIVPVFHSIHAAMMARLRNVGMLVFEPVVLDAQSLMEITPAGNGTQVAFTLVNDPFTSLDRGWPIDPAQLAALLSSRDANSAVSPNGRDNQDPMPDRLGRRDRKHNFRRAELS